MTKLPSTIIIGCWTIFIAWWMVSALRTKAVAEKQSLASMVVHRIPIGLGSWLLAFPKLHSPWNLQIIPHTVLLQLIGAGICVHGLLFTIWARRTLAGNWSSDVTFKRGHELIRTGPYRFVRHPIYTGLLGMCIGTAIVIGEVRGLVGRLLDQTQPGRTPVAPALSRRISGLQRTGENACAIRDLIQSYRPGYLCPINHQATARP